MYLYTMILGTKSPPSSRKQKEEASLSEADLQAKIDIVRKERTTTISAIRRETKRMMDELVTRKEDALEREKLESK